MNDELFRKIRDVLAEEFEIPRESIQPGSQLFQDLGIDSIDAVDLAIKLQEMTGKRIRPEDFKGVRTVGDVIRTVKVLLTT